MVRFATKKQITNALAADLRRAYLHVYDEFATDPSTMSRKLDINLRYSRELLGVLTSATLPDETENIPLVVTSDSTGETLWQCWTSHDTESRQEATARIDRWLEQQHLASPRPAKERSREGGEREVKARRQGTVTDANPAGLPTCLCGCGAVTARRSNYKPGHDARHCAQVVRQVREAWATRTVDEALQLLDRLPTESLRDKARRSLKTK